MFAPNTYLIGAQKSGTTFLASLLDQSPDVCVCDPKEPQYFSLHYETGQAAYARSFRDPEAPVTLDASTTYTFLRSRAMLEVEDAPGLADPVPERIREACPHARFIYIMREPVSRAISSFKHIMREENLPPGPHSLVRLFDEEPLLELAGRYADQIERYFEVFPRDRFLFLRFEDLITDTKGAIQACCAFLEIDASPILEAESVDTHGAHGWSQAGRLIRRKPGLKRALKRVVPKPIRGRMADMLLKRDAPEITFCDQDVVAARFTEDRARVRELTGLDI